MTAWPFGGNTKRAAVSCFGKLPAFADFVEPSHNARFSTLIREHTMQAVQGADRGGSSRTISARPRRIFWPRSDGKAYVACLWPSRDCAGRIFPFILYTEISLRNVAPMPPHLLPIWLAPTWSELEAIAVTDTGLRWNDCGEGELNLSLVQQTVKEARVNYSTAEPDPSIVTAVIRDLAPGDEKDDGDDDSGDARQRFANVLWCFTHLVEQVNTGEESRSTWLLPSSNASDVVEAATFWLVWHRHCLLEESSALPTLMLEAGADTVESHVWLMLRDLQPADLAVTLGLDTRHADLLDLRRPRAIHSEEFERFAEFIREHLLGHSALNADVSRAISLARE